jgi:hypothetical protein
MFHACAYITQLPCDLQIEYLSQLNCLDLANVYEVNRQYQLLLNDPHVIQSLNKRYRLQSNSKNFCQLVIDTLSSNLPSEIYQLY